MYDNHKAIDPNKLEVGMTVAYPNWIRSNRDFQYPIWIKATVKRITPKRTKVVLLFQDGTTIDVNLKIKKVYELDTDLEHENECVHLYKTCRNIMIDSGDGKWRLINTLSDAEIKEVYTHLTALDKIMRKEKNNINERIK